MADVNKYWNLVKNNMSSNWKPVNEAFAASECVKMILKGEATHVSISVDDWFSLGKPPAQKDGNRYLVDISNPKVIAMMWLKSLIDVMNLGCYAATDISDAMNALNNDNLDGIITDREAMIALSQITIESIKTFQNMHAEVERRMKE